MTYYDISLEIKNDMVVWDDKEGLRPEIKEGNRSETSGSLKSQVCLDSHTGTHMDAPKHFIQDGKSVSDIPLEKTIGDCEIIDCTNREKKVREQDVRDTSSEIIIFKTQNTNFLDKKTFKKDYVYIGEKACEKIVNFGYKAVGIDYLGVGKYGNTRKSHEVLLQNDVIVIEGLDLRKITPGKYEFFGFPLKIKNCDGSPMRVAIKD